MAILLAVGLGCYYLGKKRMAGGSQSPVAQTAISLSPTKEKDLESGASATKGSTATYSVELTKTPMGLGLSLADDVVTEVKPDSQAARHGRIKVWETARGRLALRQKWQGYYHHGLIPLLDGGLVTIAPNRCLRVWNINSARPGD